MVSTSVNPMIVHGTRRFFTYLTVLPAHSTKFQTVMHYGKPFLCPNYVCCQLLDCEAVGFAFVIGYTAEKPFLLDIHCLGKLIIRL